MHAHSGMTFLVFSLVISVCKAIKTLITVYTNSMFIYRCLKELLDFDAAITRTDKQGNNALHIASIHGQLHIVQFLLQNGLSVELRCVLLH